MEKSVLIQALLKDEKPNKETYIFAIEWQRYNEEIGFVKFEVLDAKEKIIFKIKFQISTADPDYAKNFVSLKDGEGSVTVG